MERSQLPLEVNREFWLKLKLAVRQTNCGRGDGARASVSTVVAPTQELCVWTSHMLHSELSSSFNLNP